MFSNIFQRVSASPTNPQAQPSAREFDIADLYRGPVATAVETGSQTPLDEKLRQAYFWIVNHAIVSPFATEQHCISGCELVAGNYRPKSFAAC